MSKVEASNIQTQYSQQLINSPQQMIKGELGKSNKNI